ncbi:MAG: histidinol-phosphatase [Rhodospirillaceae bacterium]|nr:histidinol-phosphatase [Rhodospirillaceae bacterium]MBT4464367.1 histidinol-phosphatase [Rhodospirillaceae bacterium]MBT5013182.1 histidinol-phosphatase [Rhodospirillaceae bacterium]MBT5307766.1 histidinol-phosphatase [Rhodospirillaceae bacterium]MBT6407102.1 histidinol-phosphatase [Rhodospirillaceae bacterium]
MSAAVPEQALELAVRAADAAGEVARKYFRSSFDVEKKDDESPVTIADREAETVIRDIIEEVFPEHGIFGEEHGNVRTDAEYVWTLDPIDGTQSFVTGRPLFGTLIALLHSNRPVLGIIDMPALGERWIGADGIAATFNGTAVTTRDCTDMGNAWLSTTSPQMFEGDDAVRFETLRQKVWRTQYGSDCYAYGLLANAGLDLVVEASMQPYDYCALVPVIEGAGGVITDWQGQPLGMNSDGRVLAAGNAPLHTAAMNILNGG